MCFFQSTLRSAGARSLVGTGCYKHMAALRPNHPDQHTIAPLRKFNYTALTSANYVIIQSAVTIVFRFIIGFVLAGGLALLCLHDFPLNLIFALSVGTMAAIWGDRFILGFMSLMRYFR